MVSTVICCRARSSRATCRQSSPRPTPNACAASSSAWRTRCAALGPASTPRTHPSIRSGAALRRARVRPACRDRAGRSRPRRDAAGPAAARWRCWSRRGARRSIRSGGSRSRRRRDGRPPGVCSSTVSTCGSWMPAVSTRGVTSSSTWISRSIMRLPSPPSGPSPVRRRSPPSRAIRGRCTPSSPRRTATPPECADRSATACSRRRARCCGRSSCRSTADGRP